MMSTKRALKKSIKLLDELFSSLSRERTNAGKLKKYGNRVQDIWWIKLRDESGELDFLELLKNEIKKYGNKRS